MLPGRSVEAITGRRTRLCRNLGISHTRNASPYKIGHRTLVAKTCPGCGHLLSSKWFTRRSNGQSSRECTRCLTAKGYAPTRRSLEREVAAQRNRTLTEGSVNASASRSWFPWLQKDLDVIADPLLTLEDKALLVGRTYGATKLKCRELGFSSKRKNGLGDPLKDGWKIEGAKGGLIE